MIKICTDIDQSKKLIELGINVNTADMWYQHIGYSITDGKEKPTYFPMIIRDNISDDDIPAWSLVALLKCLNEINPQVYTPILFPSEGKWILQFTEYGHGNVCVVSCDNPIDACYEMVLKLYEQKLL